MAKKKSPLKKIFTTFFLVALFVASILAWIAWYYIWSPNVMMTEKSKFIFIHTGWKFDDVVNYLSKEKIIKHKSTFVWLAEKKNYKNHVYPGRYLISKDMSNEQLVNLLRSGMQVPLNVVLNNVRVRQDLASQVHQQLEADSTDLMQLLNDSSFINPLGFDTGTVISLFIPNTYQFYWTTSAKQFVVRMYKEYRNFWNAERKLKAGEIGLTPIEVSSLASIVQQETNMEDDKSLIAGVYINRIKKGIPLEADPTLKFAIGDFTRQRLLNEDKLVKSPYNTYMYKGIPPGPICMPTASTIDAVLNYAHHNYLFFCAREDFSGYSNFAETYDEHLVNARKYQSALNRKKIMR